MGRKLQYPSAPCLSLSPGILGLLAPSPIKRDNVLPADASLTHGALLPVWPCLQPLGKKYKVCSNTKRVFKVPSPLHFPVHLMSALPDEDRANWMEEKEEKTRKQVKPQKSHRHRTGAHCTSLPRYCLLYCYSFQSFCNFQQTCSLNFSSFSHLQYLKFFHLQHTWSTPPSLSLPPPLTQPLHFLPLNLISQFNRFLFSPNSILAPIPPDSHRYSPTVPFPSHFKLSKIPISMTFNLSRDLALSTRPLSLGLTTPPHTSYLNIDLQSLDLALLREGHLPETESLSHLYLCQQLGRSNGVLASPARKCRVFHSPCHLLLRPCHTRTSS